jgi:mannose/cellobiose epimerase-like protein (N-acyl-D-glucosamine 2-epimerase family)
MASTQVLKGFNVQLPIIGEITDLHPENRTFDVKTRSGNIFNVRVRDTTWFDAVKNLDRIDRRRPRVCAGESQQKCWDNLRIGDLIAVEGVYSRNDDNESYDALAIHELISHLGYYHFEHTFWWIAQIEALGERWLDNLFGDKATYSIDDFSALYRTSLNIQGEAVHDGQERQEVATLARLIYGFASAYLMTGEERFFIAAKAGIDYQREAFRSTSADGRFCFWLHARMRDRNGRYTVLTSLNDEDINSLPLYEQIYAIAGLAQFYRITNDWEVLYDIRRTIASFNQFYADRGADGVLDGYFSHIDGVEFNWNSSKLDERATRAQKNWNSVGDHLPAYLINLLLALDPLPEIEEGEDKEAIIKDLNEFKKNAREILDVTSRLIVEKFDQPGNPYVCERFDREWHPNFSWGWQQNRGVVGHNLKIAWNLTRVANFYKMEGLDAEADKLSKFANRLGQDMARLGIDQIRSGAFDTVERNPSNGNPLEFPWLNTKDFWQQEQGILAYLILFGYSILEGQSDHSEDYLTLARELQAIWNLYFLDRERNGVFFRVSDNALPVIASTYGDKGNHSISGYHVFELSYLAHVYLRTYLPRNQRHHSGLVLHFRPMNNRPFRSINVLPDFLGKDAIELKEVIVNGLQRQIVDPGNFQIPLRDSDRDSKITVVFQQTEKLFNSLSPFIAIQDQRSI